MFTNPTANPMLFHLSKSTISPRNIILTIVIPGHDQNHNYQQLASNIALNNNVAISPDNNHHNLNNINLHNNQ
ncbi:hypothetical protein RhiirB3_443956 [Rhizophagus irregularis]|nr:hypothetical protein RhiirB3_443956 [Rhizophagus irregularis]